MAGRVIRSRATFPSALRRSSRCELDLRRRGASSDVRAPPSGAGRPRTPPRRSSRPRHDRERAHPVLTHHTHELLERRLLRRRDHGRRHDLSNGAVSSSTPPGSGRPSCSYSTVGRRRGPQGARPAPRGRSAATSGPCCLAQAVTRRRDRSRRAPARRAERSHRRRAHGLLIEAGLTLAVRARSRRGARADRRRSRSTLTGAPTAPSGVLDEHAPRIEHFITTG